MQYECNELKLNKAETRMYKSRAYFMRRENWVQHLHHQQQHCKLKKKCISRISLHFSAICSSSVICIEMCIYLI